jgi:SAM-dependent methyltransferase
MTETAPPEVAPVDYVARWRSIVDRRRVQMDAAYAASGLSSGDYWARRAGTYRQALHERVKEDPLVVRLESTVTSKTTLIDVGAGTGRHTLALAPLVKAVTAVDPSDAMLNFLRKDAATADLRNVSVVVSDWMDATVPAADIVICSHVLYPIADVVPFVRRLEDHAASRVFVYLRLDPLPTDMGLWLEFYGEPLQPQPSAVDLFNLLVQIRIFADLEVVEHQFSWSFADLDEAVSQLRNTLCIREDDEDATRKLAGLLSERLVRWDNGRLGPEPRPLRSAVISWTPAGREARPR